MGKLWNFEAKEWIIDQLYWRIVKNIEKNDWAKAVAIKAPERLA